MMKGRRMMEVLLFAGIAEAAGVSAVEIEAEGKFTVTQLKRLLASMYPDKGLAGKLASCFAAVNQQYCADDTDISAVQEVALIPPVSGG